MELDFAAVSVNGELFRGRWQCSTLAMLREKDGKDWLEYLGLPHLWVDVEGNVGGTIKH